MFDTHTHLYFSEFDTDREAVIERMHSAGVDQALVVGVDMQTSDQAVQLVQNYDGLFATVGIHPYDAVKPTNQLMNSLQTLAKKPSVKAIGEVGLDYKVFDGVEPDRALQKQLFLACIDLANKQNLPLIVHSRMAELDCIELLRKNAPIEGAVIHCFSADYAVAKRALDVGLMISFTAMLTYPKNAELRAVAKKMPRDRVMLETDCPFLPPEGLRGGRCEPMHVRDTALMLAELWGIPIEEVDRMTTENAQLFFHT